MISVVRKLAQECARPSCAVFLTVAGGTLFSSCVPQDYELGQRIEMGAFAFQVEGASEGVRASSTREIVINSETGSEVRVGPGSGPTRQISVRLRLLSNESRPRNSLDRFLDGMDRPRGEGVTFRLDLSPHYILVDSHGHEFKGGVGVDLRMGFSIEDEGGFAFSSNEPFRAEHFDLRSEDFRLIITNPDRQDGQPRKVSIQL